MKFFIFLFLFFVLFGRSKKLESDEYDEDENEEVDLVELLKKLQDQIDDVLGDDSTEFRFTIQDIDEDDEDGTTVYTILLGGDDDLDESEEIDSDKQNFLRQFKNKIHQTNGFLDEDEEEEVEVIDSDESRGKKGKPVPKTGESKRIEPEENKKKTSGKKQKLTKEVQKKHYDMKKKKGVISTESDEKDLLRVINRKNKNSKASGFQVLEIENTWVYVDESVEDENEKEMTIFEDVELYKDTQEEKEKKKIEEDSIEIILDDGFELESDKEMRNFKVSLMEKVQRALDKKSKEEENFKILSKVYDGIDSGKVPPTKGIKAIKTIINKVNTSEFYGEGYFQLFRIYSNPRFDNVFNMSFAKQYLFDATLKGHAKAQLFMALFLQNKIISGAEFLSLNGSYFDDSEKSLPNMIDMDSVALTYFFFSALGGNKEAMIILANKYYYGVGVKRDCEISGNYFSLGLKGVDINGVYQPAYGEKLFFSSSKSLKKKEKEEDIMDFLKYSAEKGDTGAQIAVGYAKMMGLRGQEQNGEMAREYFERAIRNGDIGGYSPLGTLLINGYGGVESDNKTAKELFEKGAELGDSKSMNGLGYMYMQGRGVERDLEKAFYYFNESAHLGSPEAQFNVATMYLQGTFVKKNTILAFKFMKMSANAGKVVAKKWLGDFYRHGTGVSRSCVTSTRYYQDFAKEKYYAKYGDSAFDKYIEGNYEESLLDLLILAELGEETAQLNAAHALENNQGKLLFDEGIDLKSVSYKMYKKASIQGNNKALIILGDYEFYGIGMNEPNYTKALMYYEKAGKSRSPEGNYNMGYMYEYGLGIKKDYHLAKRHYQLAQQYEKNAYIVVNYATAKLLLKWGWSYVDMYIKGELEIKKMFKEYENLVWISDFMEEPIISFLFGDLDHLRELFYLIIVSMFYFVISYVKNTMVKKEKELEEEKKKNDENNNTNESKDSEKKEEIEVTEKKEEEEEEEEKKEEEVEIRENVE